MSDLKIREATKSDLPAVIELYKQGFQLKLPLTLAETEKIYSEFAKYPDYKLYVGEMEGIIVGTFTLLMMHMLGGTDSSKMSAIVEDVTVHPGHQKKGIGKKMMAFAMVRCREAGCYKMALSSNLKRKEAHQFYEGLGFKHHGYSYLIEL